MRTHSIAPTRPLPSSRIFVGLHRIVKLDALFLGVVQLFQPGGHLRLAAAVDDVHMLCAQTLGAARRIHGHVAAAHDGHGVLDVD